MEKKKLRSERGGIPHGKEGRKDAVRGKRKLFPSSPQEDSCRSQKSLARH